MHLTCFSAASLCLCTLFVKAVVATNIMYVVGQYPEFLNEHWNFLQTVILKLFEFMHETFEGVQEMASCCLPFFLSSSISFSFLMFVFRSWCQSVDTFLKIAKKCRGEFVVIQQNEEVPFVNKILSQLPNIIVKLCPEHVASRKMYSSSFC